MNKFISAISIFVIFIFISCQERPKSGRELSSKEIADLIDVAKKFDAKIETGSVLLLIPVEGCSECIKYALDFALQHQESKKLLVVLSSYNATINALTLKEFNFNKQKIIADVKGMFIDADLVKIHPVLIQIFNNDRIYSTKLDPSHIKEELESIAQSLN